MTTTTAPPQRTDPPPTRRAGRPRMWFGPCSYCDQPIKARGLCSGCYSRWYHAGGDARKISNTAKRLGVNVLAYFEEQHERCVALELDECALWPFATDRAGYGRLSVKGRPIGAHVLACERLHGPRPDGLQVRHWHCGNPACFNARHLRWGTAGENHADAVRHGSQPDCFSRHEVGRIRFLAGLGWSPQTVAERLSADPVRVRNVAAGTTYGSIPTKRVIARSTAAGVTPASTLP